MPPVHPIHRRYHAEELVRLRRSDDERRYVASQRTGRIDPNPHQIDAVIFALGRVREGGCILADEVGLLQTVIAAGDRRTGAAQPGGSESPWYSRPGGSGIGEQSRDRMTIRPGQN